MGYQSVKFLQFDGKDNPKLHIAYFIETCTKSNTKGKLLIKKFCHVNTLFIEEIKNKKLK